MKTIRNAGTAPLGQRRPDLCWAPQSSMRVRTSSRRLCILSAFLLRIRKEANWKPRNLLMTKSFKVVPIAFFCQSNISLGPRDTLIRLILAYSSRLLFRKAHCTLRALKRARQNAFAGFKPCADLNEPVSSKSSAHLQSARLRNQNVFFLLIIKNL